MHRAVRSLGARSGWYGVGCLKDRGSFEGWRLNVESECNRLRDFQKKELSAVGDAAAARKLIRLLDTLSSRLCLLLDTAEVCASSHSDASAREAASKSYSLLSMFVTKLNMDSILYKPLASVVDNDALFGGLSDEEQRIGKSLKLEFERDGIHLAESKKVGVEKLQAELRAAEQAFSRVEHTGVGEVELTLKESGQLLMDSLSLSRFGRVVPPKVLMRVDIPILNLVLRTASDGDVRKRFYLKAHSDNSLSVLNRLIKTRAELASLLGFKSYAHMTTSYRMAGSPERVNEFLKGFTKSISSTAKRQTEMLGELKGGKIQAWDVAYFSNKLLDAKYGSLLAQASSYFSVTQCLNGLELVTKELFGINFKQVPMDPGEAWADDIQKIVLTEQDGGHEVGVLYLDLYYRPGKYPNPAHFQVQCAHLSRPLEYFFNDDESRNEYQLPSSVLVCNFDKSCQSLQHTQVQTLFHEFGHALHTLLSRTEFQHLSGTRGELDFVETPSQLMEYFCYDERVLKKFAFHHETGEAIPSEVVNALRGSKRMFQAMEVQQQTMFAACDMKLFSDSELLDEGSATEELIKLHDAYTQVPHVPGTFWLTKFSHFVNYGAAYYSYTFARAFAADLWYTCFHKDPLNREVGMAYRNNILRHGGTRDPNAMMQDMLKRPPQFDAFINEIKGLD